MDLTVCINKTFCVYIDCIHLMHGPNCIASRRVFSLMDLLGNSSDWNAKLHDNFWCIGADIRGHIHRLKLILANNNLSDCNAKLHDKFGCIGADIRGHIHRLKLNLANNNLRSNDICIISQCRLIYSGLVIHIVH